jgi:predicted enzyme related to lactoylglutathione lyase
MVSVRDFRGMDLFRMRSHILLMKILGTLTRIYTTTFDETLRFYEDLTGTKAGIRFALPAAGLELAQVQDILIIAGSDDTLQPFRSTNATFLVDSLEEYHRFLTAHGAEIIRQPQTVPTGMNMTIRHPDGSVVEYVEHRKNS